MDENINKGIIDEFGMPFNNIYNSWGNIEIISSTRFKITNVYFNDNIECIVVNNIGSSRSNHNHVTIRSSYNLIY